MDKNEIANLFTVLRGGIIRGLTREEDTLRFKIVIPELARKEDPETDFFFASLQGCYEFNLQPFRNENTVIRELEQVERLAPEILEAEVDGERVKVFCAHKGVSTGARISLRAERFEVYNTSFDLLDVDALAALRFGNPN